MDELRVPEVDVGGIDHYVIGAQHPCESASSSDVHTPAFLPGHYWLCSREKLHRESGTECTSVRQIDHYGLFTLKPPVRQITTVCVSFDQ